MSELQIMRLGFTIMKRWLENRNVGKDFAQYLLSFGYETVGIYGAGDVGALLYAELRGKVKVPYFIDRNAETFCEIDSVPVILPQDLFQYPACDIIIVTPLSGFESIAEIIKAQHPNQPLLSIRDAVYEL
ncbi:nucleoside-diphosphate sugar epimerase/dehydratase [Desulfitobacterium hafniense]|uniref:Uncharacterized protein n=1 Tax=Desulfitobacterium hafniense (strain Y51) TaxID=138119 RepID=Q24T36_DESHY|nr:hypothetical protein [Desulfitobacterium hafniense]BAE84806.1 hypothetical protein DSY3017 [Desulfitobacterium hafniense Y51]